MLNYVYSNLFEMWHSSILEHLARSLFHERTLKISLHVLLLEKQNSGFSVSDFKRDSARIEILTVPAVSLVD